MSVTAIMTIWPEAFPQDIQVVSGKSGDVKNNTVYIYREIRYIVPFA